MKIPRQGLEKYYLRLAHTFTFSKLTLRNLLSKCGFEVLNQTDFDKGDQWVLCKKTKHTGININNNHYIENIEKIDNYRKICKEDKND